MTIREGKALKFLYVPDSYAGGIQEGDETPVFIDGVDPAGSAAAVAADLATHEGLTGTAVHGLGSASVLNATTTGEDLVTATDADEARNAILAAPLRENTIFIATPTRNFGLSDEGQVLAATSLATTTAFQMTAAVSNSFTIGAQIAVERHNVFATTIACDSGITLNGNSVGGGIRISKRFGRVTLRKIAATEWVAWGDWEPLVATYTVTTTAPSEAHTLNSFGVSASTVVDWGDGSTSTYTGTALRTHTYADAGTYTVTIRQPQNVTTLDVRDNHVTLDSSTVMIDNVAIFIATTLRNDSAVDTADMATWSPSDWRLFSMPSGGAYTVNTADMATWSPTIWWLYSMPSGGAYTVNTADMATWSPSSWYLHSMPSGGAYTVNTADMATWSPPDWRLFSMPSGGAYTVNTADMATWSPSTWWLLHSMPSGGAYTVNTADMATWSPTIWLLFSMPSGGAYTVNTADMATWSPSIWRLNSMPSGDTVWNVSTGGFAGFIKCTDFQMQDNALTEIQVDTALWSLYQASITPRTATGGTINVGGTNAAPSGVFQPASVCPVTVATDGKEVANELLNDGCAVGFNVWATVTTS